MVERELDFTSADIETFAAASGDRNPLHLDPAFARRTAFGSPLVHGGLVAIALLGQLAPDDLERVRSLRVQFAGPALPGQRYRARVKRLGDDSWEAQLVGRGKLLTRVLATCEPLEARGDLAPRGDVALVSVSSERSQRQMREAPASPAPHALSAGRSITGRYGAGPGLAELAARMGTQTMHPGLLEAIAWASYIVGMEVPGLHSLLSGVTLSVCGNPRPADGFSVRIRRRDSRSGHLVLEGELHDSRGAPAVLGTIDCFALAPVELPDAALLGLDGSIERERGQVVVIGASRGFGAALSLSLLARGYRVHGVYSRSSTSAAELTRLAGSHADRLQMHRLDARDTNALRTLAERVKAQGELVGLVLNAALAPLPMRVREESGAELADYVGENVRLAAVPLGVLQSRLARHGWVLFVSSAALLAPPRDWPHYVAAKGALEGLAAWSARDANRLRAVVLRPPAMRTELTNTPSGRIAAVSVEEVAMWTTARLAGGELPLGLSVLSPEPAMFTPAEVGPSG